MSPTTITFTDRQLAVAVFVIKLKKLLSSVSLTPEEWEQAAAQANITDGQTGRNAKYAFTQFAEKITGEKPVATASKRKSATVVDGSDEGGPSTKKPMAKAIKAKAAPGKKKGQSSKDNSGENADDDSASSV